MKASIEDELLMRAEYLDDVEKIRIATQNRLRSVTERGIELDISYEEQLKALEAIESQAIKSLEKLMKRHPLGKWIESTVGVGLKQGSRLIAAIGDITYNHLDDRPRRGPAELWAYCGYSPEQKRRKGQKSNWNHQAKMRAFLVAESCIKQRHSPYRNVYDKAKASWESRDISDGHKHNHALRVTAKEILKDLFLEAKKVNV